MTTEHAGPQEGDRVRLTYGDGSSVEGTWRAVLELDDGTLHTHTRGQVRREVIAATGRPAACRSREWGLCNGVGCPECNDKPTL